MRSVILAVAILCIPVAVNAAICRHSGAYFPGSSYSTCPECAVEGRIPAGYHWYNTHLAPSGSRDGRESGQEYGDGPTQYNTTQYPASYAYPQPARQR